MKLKTDSIVDSVEVSLNKKIDKVEKEELNNIDYLKLCKVQFGDILNVDSSDLLYFRNLKELSIEGCIIDKIFLQNIKSCVTLKKIDFINCDFVDFVDNFFEGLSIKELTLNNVIGLNNIVFDDLNCLTFVNCKFNCSIGNVDVLDIHHSDNTNINFSNSNISEIIINDKDNIDKYSSLNCTITVKNDFEEVIGG